MRRVLVGIRGEGGRAPMPRAVILCEKGLVGKRSKPGVEGIGSVSSCLRLEERDGSEDSV